MRTLVGMLVLLPPLFLAPEAPAAPLAPSEVSRSEALAVDFFDDFEDGIFPDGEPEEPAFYETFCGSVAESEGVLALTGPGTSLCPGPALGAATYLTAFPVAGGAEIRALYQLDDPPLNQSYGVEASNLVEGNGDDFARLVLTKRDLGLGPQIFLFLEADPPGSVVGNRTLSISGFTHIELQLVLEPSDGSLTPRGWYRLCAGLPCEGSASLVPSIGGTLDAADTFAAGLVALSPSGSMFTRRVEEWSVVPEPAPPLDAAAALLTLGALAARPRRGHAVAPCASRSVAR